MIGTASSESSMAGSRSPGAALVPVVRAARRCLRPGADLRSVIAVSRAIAEAAGGLAFGVRRRALRCERFAPRCLSEQRGRPLDVGFGA